MKMEKEASVSLENIPLLLIMTIFFVGTAYAVEWVGNNITYLATEDTPYYHNLTANISAPASDMAFSVDTINTIFLWNNQQVNYSSISNWLFMFNSTAGFFLANTSRDNETGNFSIPMKVTWNSGSQASTATFLFNITAVNDAPQFVNLQNRSFNATELFEYTINITDEENNFPFKLNITFLNCSVAQWSTRNCTNVGNRTLFNSSQYSINSTTGRINISFTPQRNDVGEYTINFTIGDSGNTSLPYNASRSQIVNFTVLNQNVAPYFTYVCNSERNTTENSLFNCLINASDIDEINNLTFTANYSWFKFNSTGTNSTTAAVNITTGFNASVLVNFTATDIEVGNWSINLTVKDTGGPIKSNSTVFYFFVANINDSVSLERPNNVTIYTSNGQFLLYVNASDDDLLIPDKTVYNETLTFTANHTNITISSSYISGTNKTRATLGFNSTGLGSGSHLINLSVRDANNFSIDSKIFNITVIVNNAPQWNAGTQTNLSLLENTAFYLNLTQNVTDADSDSINFTSVNDTSFPSFSLNLTTGIINFTPIDEDVGQHILIINATDGKTPTLLTFNFTVNNTNDLPSIEALQGNNATISWPSVNVSEDNSTTLFMFVQDNDVLIPAAQRGFYNESFRVNLTIQGINATLFNFGSGSYFSANRTRFTATFSPRNSDIGHYNVTINVTDASNASYALSFNLTVLALADPPVLSSIGNLVYSIREAIYFDANVTDEEDGSDSSLNSNFTFVLQNLTARGNFLSINSTSGLINFTFNQTYAGLWIFNVSVNDSSGLSDSEVFNITVYDYPLILSPNTTLQFNLEENSSSQLNFTINHTVQNRLNYTLLINGIIRNSTLGNGNATAFLWSFSPNFTDETSCSGALNLTLNVSNAKLSNLTSWSVTINHTNSPLTFSGSIGGDDNLIVGGASASFVLSDYFSDIDTLDSCTNQNNSVRFNYTVLNYTGTPMSVSVTNWTNSTPTPSINFTHPSSGTVTANFTVFGLEYNESGSLVSAVASNNFSVQLTISTTTTQTPTSGGGSSGSTTQEKIVSLKIITPNPIKAKKKDHLVVSIELLNDGEVSLNNINLSSLLYKNGLLRSDMRSVLSSAQLSTLPAGTSENLTLTIDVDTQETGIFENIINASIGSPKYVSSGKLYIEINDNEQIIEKILFTQEFIIGNPECAELKELVDSANASLRAGRYNEANIQLEEAIEACKRAISQPASMRLRSSIRENLFSFVSILSLIALALGFAYYYLKRYRELRKI